MNNSKQPEFDPPLRSCPLCESNKIGKFDHDYNKVTIFRCEACELLFMNPQYTDRHLSDFYAKYTPHEAPQQTVINQRRRMSKQDDVELVEKFVRPGSFLSIGCGDGLELEVARERGWNVEGFDVDSETTRAVSSRLNLKVYHGDFFRCPWQLEHYDCVFMDQVLEHPKNPQDYLRAVHRILRPGGVLFIGCPNIDSISNWYKGWLGRIGLKSRRRGKHYDTSHHLFYYSPRALTRILNQGYGFEVLAVEGDPLSGQKPFVPGSSWWDQLSLLIRKRYPLFDSTFRLVCRKTDHEPIGISRAA